MMSLDLKIIIVSLISLFIIGIVLYFKGRQSKDSRVGIANERQVGIIIMIMVPVFSTLAGLATLAKPNDLQTHITIMEKSAERLEKTCNSFLDFRKSLKSKDKKDE